MEVDLVLKSRLFSCSIIHAAHFSKSEWSSQCQLQLFNHNVKNSWVTDALTKGRNVIVVAHTVSVATNHFSSRFMTDTEACVNEFKPVGYEITPSVLSLLKIVDLHMCIWWVF